MEGEGPPGPGTHGSGTVVVAVSPPGASEGEGVGGGAVVVGGASAGESARDAGVGVTLGTPALVGQALRPAHHRHRQGVGEGASRPPHDTEGVGKARVALVPNRQTGYGGKGEGGRGGCWP